QCLAMPRNEAMGSGLPLFTPSLQELAAAYTDRNMAIVAAYRTGAYSYQQIADFFKIHLSTVGRAVRRALDKNTVQQWKT
ncbi:MAG: hypothetical protein KDI89_06780, partial [Gammaproteobacteria bacterium]|nr:hypothetical protein [Gammaproteobacteria bacterium]